MDTYQSTVGRTGHRKREFRYDEDVLVGVPELPGGILMLAMDVIAQAESGDLADRVGQVKTVRDLVTSVFEIIDAALDDASAKRIHDRWDGKVKQWPLGFQDLVGLVSAIIRLYTTSGGVDVDPLDGSSPSASSSSNGGRKSTGGQPPKASSRSRSRSNGSRTSSTGSSSKGRTQKGARA